MQNNKDEDKIVKDVIPRLDSMESFQRWLMLLIAHLATLDLSVVLRATFVRPTLNHPSMEAHLNGQPAMAPVGQMFIPAEPPPGPWSAKWNDSSCV